MAETANFEKVEVDSQLAERRLLTEVEHILEGMDEAGNVHPAVLEDVGTNLKTGVNEIAMPFAVSTTIHRVEYASDDTGRQHRIISWLGKNIVRNAMNGKLFHWHPAAHERVDVEVDESGYAQEHLYAGVAQSFISPKMSPYDAPAGVAKSEHLANDDSVRVSFAVTNSKGEIIARRLESLLVRDIPLEAWVAMLKDPNNIFGKSLDLEDERSALSVMKLFKQMDLPEDKLPEGPITLVAAVQKYIKDNDAYDSVGYQLEKFRRDQEIYKHQAELSAHEWLHFEVELARSIKAEQATLPVRAMIISLQEQWSDEQLEVISEHAQEDSNYKMTRPLAAMLELAKRNLIRGKAAIATNNEEVMAQVTSVDVYGLQNKIQSLQIMYANNLLSEQEYHRAQANIERTVAAQNIRGGGGCIDDVDAHFRAAVQDGSTNKQSSQDQPSDWEKGNRKWKLGKCQVKICPSPKPTEVGPCSVCKRCQAVFDSGGDPTKPGLAALFTLKKPTETPPSVETKKAEPEEELAATSSPSVKSMNRVGQAALVLAS